MCCSGICEILCSVFGWTKHIKKLSIFIMMMMMMLSWVLTLNFWGWWRGGGGWGCINDKRSNDHIEGYFTCGDQWCWEILSLIYLSKYKMLRLSTIFHGLNFIIALAEGLFHRTVIQSFLPSMVCARGARNLQHSSECLLTGTRHNSTQKKRNKRNCPAFLWTEPRPTPIHVHSQVGLMLQFCQITFFMFS